LSARSRMFKFSDAFCLAGPLINYVAALINPHGNKGRGVVFTFTGRRVRVPFALRGD
jgi:hypothetical protein